MSSRRNIPSIGVVAAGLCMAGAGGALAQSVVRAPDTMPATPRFAVLPATHSDLAAQAGGLTTWNFSYTYKSRNYTDVFVGNAPSGAATTTPTFIIPLKIVVSSGAQTFSTSTVQSNGQTALANTTNSPIFQERNRLHRSGKPIWGRLSMRTPSSVKAFGRPLTGQPRLPRAPRQRLR